MNVQIGSVGANGKYSDLRFWGLAAHRDALWSRGVPRAVFQAGQSSLAAQEVPRVALEFNFVTNLFEKKKKQTKKQSLLVKN